MNNSLTRSFFAFVFVLLLTACGGDSNTSASVEASATIGTEGGTLTGPDGVELIVPAGALAELTTIRIVRTSVGAPQEPPDDYTLQGAIYEFLPHGLTFAEPVTIRMPAGTVPVGGSVSPFTASPDEASWRRLEGSVSDGMLSWETLSFSWFVAGACYLKEADPQSCVSATINPQLTATPDTAATIFSQSLNHKAWSVTQAAAMTVAFDLSAPVDCINRNEARIKVTRRASAGLAATTVLDQSVTLVPDVTNNLRSRQTVNWQFSLSQDDNGTAIYDVLFTCVRFAGARRSIGGFLLFKTNVSAQQQPIFTTQPADATVTEPLMANFTVVATGDPVPTLQWQRSSDGLNWVNIDGATAASYTTPATTAAADNGSRFRAVATNVAGSVTSNSAMLTVNAQTSGSWQAPENIAAAGVNFEPSVGFDGTGRAYTVWNAGTTGVTYFSIRSTTGVWSAPSTIDGPFTGGFAARIAVAPNGSAVAAWESSNRIVANRYDGAAWSTPVQVDTGHTFAVNPSIGIDDSGRAVVVWYAFDGVRYRAFASANLSGNTWSAPVALDGYDASTPQVAVNSQGKGFAIFAERNGSQQNSLQAVPIDLASSGVFGTKQELRPFGGLIGQKRVSIDASGAAMAVWHDTGAGDNLRWSRFTPGSGAWTTPADLALNVPPRTDLYGRPYNLALSSATTGDVIVAWGQNNIADGGVSDEVVFSRRFSVGTGAWELPERRSSNVAGAKDYAENPRVAISGAGRVAVIWLQYNGDVYQVWGQVFDGGWRTAQSLMTSPNDISVSNEYTMAMDSNGMPLAVWAELPPSGSNRPLVGSVWR